MKIHTPNIFTIAPGASEPIYRQLMDQIRRMTMAGQLNDGDLLPSVRDVAQGLTLNPMTVSKAYNYLEVEGLLQRQRGIGMLIHISTEKKSRAEKVDEREQLLRPTLKRAAKEVRQKIAISLQFPISSLYLMLEQNAESPLMRGINGISGANGNVEELKHAKKRLGEFITKFMLLNARDQSLINNFLSVMLKNYNK